MVNAIARIKVSPWHTAGQRNGTPAAVGPRDSFSIVAPFLANRVRTLSGRAAIRWSRC